MATPGPPILPTTTPNPPPSDTSLTSPQNPTAFRAFMGRLQAQVTTTLSNRRPWAELLDRTTFSKPESITDATTRIRKNYSYFRVNYLTTISLILLLSLFWHPFSLLTLTFLIAAWGFLYLFKPADQPLTILNRTFSDKETLGMLILLSVFVIFLTDVGSVIMSALVVGVGIVVAHGAFRQPEDLFLDEQESGASVGFLSFFGLAASNAAASAAAAAAPAVARV